MDTTRLQNHFSFGENWQSFVEEVEEKHIQQAVKSLSKLFPNDDLRGKTFLDIGCGSGMSMLAAVILGASEVNGFDIDPNSVKATQTLFEKYAPEGTIWTVREISVLDKESLPSEKYDVVHSWGVLHHTGDMWRAITNASTLVKEEGLFLVALYRKTPLCSLWKIEKAIYAHSPGFVQKLISLPYVCLYYLRILIGGQRPKDFIETYNNVRGMDFHHDIHDWLGGFPYQSVEPSEVVKNIEKLGFQSKYVYDNCKGTKGFFGTGCDEYLFVRDAKINVAK
ncbi:class I SAM-dependent methyltransferase [Terasakiella pusilla]|uniref:class I SAM-dependent methyltransferase n=1 Tax=Terasakiella pusilla TaxID=64973 RepID=UPI0006893191|nr:class I SAM-dependent methyltransferase [Terasakiella pusilla]